MQEGNWDEILNVRYLLSACGALENKSSAKMIMIRQFCWILHFLFLFHVYLDNQTKWYSFVVAGLYLCIYGIEIIGLGKWVAMSRFVVFMEYLWTISQVC